MKIPEKEYSIETFTEALMGIVLPSHQRLKVACFMTAFSKWHDPTKMVNLENIFRKYGVYIDKLGDIRRLKTRYFDSQLRDYKTAIFYTYLDPASKVLVCFTDEKTEAIEQILGHIAENAKGFYYLFISSRTFEKLREEILEFDPFAKCTYFSAKYVPQLTRKSHVRPNIEKTIMYYGDDGLETLEEFSQYYGVYPTIMRYYIHEKGNYEISHNGIFSLWAEESPYESRQFLLYLSNIALKDTLISREIIETSNYELIPVKTEKKIFKIPKITPWIIKFSREIEFEDSSALIEVMTTNGFSLFNEILEKGSVRLNGMVIDDKKQTIFSIDVDDERINIAPIGEPCFDSFMRFYKTILENFDPDATCVKFEG